MSDTTGGAPALPATPALEITAGATPSPGIAPADPAPDASPTPADPPAPAADPATPPAPDPAAEPATPAPDKPAVEEHWKEPSALSTEEPKPADPAQPGDPAAPPPDAPVGYEFTFPEGVTVAEPELAPFVDILRANNITPQAGQNLLDMYTNRLQQDQINTLANQHKVFADYRRESLGAVKADPELGGAGYETTRTAAARGRDLLLGNNPEHRAEFENFLNRTGAGEQLALWRIFVAADRLFRAPAAPATPPMPAQGAQGRGPQRGMNSLFRNPTGR